MLSKMFDLENQRLFHWVVRECDSKNALIKFVQQKKKRIQCCSVQFRDQTI